MSQNQGENTSFDSPEGDFSPEEFIAIKENFIPGLTLEGVGFEQKTAVLSVDLLPS